MYYTKTLKITFMLCISITLHAQVSTDSELFQTLQSLDSSFFERGFNQCEAGYLEKMVSKDLKFYHDQSGLQDYETFIENSRKYICSNLDMKPVRKLEPGSLSVYPLYQNGTLYGAIQHGVHHFYIREKGKEDIWTSKAKFTHVWTLENDEWKITEVLSYDHQDTR